MSPVDGSARLCRSLRQISSIINHLSQPTLTHFDTGNAEFIIVVFSETSPTFHLHNKKSIRINKLLSNMTALLVNILSCFASTF